jgi:hypothetical protein
MQRASYGVPHLILFVLPIYSKQYDKQSSNFLLIMAIVFFSDARNSEVKHTPKYTTAPDTKTTNTAEQLTKYTSPKAMKMHTALREVAGDGQLLREHTPTLMQTQATPFFGHTPTKSLGPTTNMFLQVMMDSSPAFSTRTPTSSPFLSSRLADFEQPCIRKGKNEPSSWPQIRSTSVFLPDLLPIITAEPDPLSLRRAR